MSDYQESISAYDWEFGDGNIATGENVSHAYTAPGNYTARLTVTSFSGKTDVMTKTVTITDNFPGYRYFRFVGLDCHYTYRSPEIHHFAFLKGSEEFPDQVMTSNNSLGITLDASWGDNAYQAFDKDLSTSWSSHNYFTPVTLDIDVSEEQRFVPTGLSMSMESSTNRFMDFYVVASVDQFMWDTLYVNPSGNNSLENILFENVPYVEITSPVSGSVFNEGDNMTLKAATYNMPSAVDKVLYYANGVYVGQSTVSSTYDYLWNSVSANTYLLTAKAVYNSLADTTTSSAISIEVQAPPVFSGINITPADISVDSSSILQFSAEAVDQYDQVLSSQPSFTWDATGGSIDGSGLFTANDNTGDYYIKATATDGVTITDSVMITISLPGTGCTENFDDNSLSSMWTTIIQCEDSQGSVTETGGQLVIDAETSACNNFYSSPRKFFNGIISTPISGDFEVSVKVMSYNSADGGSRAGIIISPDITAYGTSAAAGLASVNTRPSDDEFRLYTDVNQDGWLETSDGTGGVSTFPKWMKIVRTGDDVSGYYSTDSTNWTLIGTRTIGYGSSPMEVALVAAQSSVVYDNLVFSTCPSTPAIPPSVFISADDSTVLEGATVNFDGSASLPGSDASSITSYEWDFRDGNTATGATPSNTFSSNGTYNVVLTITDDQDKKATDSLEIVVDIVSNTTYTGASDISIYPNPVVDYLTVEGSNADFRIVSVIGEVVMTGKVEDKSIDLTALSPGMYILNIENVNFRIIKE